MRLLLSAYACRPGEGSEAGSGWGWATHLAARGITVHVLTSSNNRDVIEVELQRREYPNLSFSFVIAAIDRSDGSGLHYASWQWSILGVARQLFKDAPFDLVHHVTFGSIHVPTQLWRLGVPTLFGPIGGGQTAPLSMLSYFKGSRLKELVRSAQTFLLRASPLHNAWLKRMTCVFATNEETVALAHLLGAPRVYLGLDTGLPDDIFPPAPRSFSTRQGPLRLLWTGRIMARKALSLTLDSLAYANRNGVVATLTVIGDGVPGATLKEMLASRGLERVVSLLGRQSWEKVQMAYRSHDGFLFTSLRDSFGSQHLEAMAHGLPLIHLRLHGAKVFVPSAAALQVEVKGRKETVQALGEAILRFASFSCQQRNSMSRAGWEAAQEFSWTKRAARAEQFYLRVLVGEALPPSDLRRCSETAIVGLL